MVTGTSGKIFDDDADESATVVALTGGCGMFFTATVLVSAQHR